MKTLVLFNHKGGVGKTSLAYPDDEHPALRSLREAAVDDEPEAAEERDAAREALAEPSGLTTDELRRRLAKTDDE